MNNKELMIALLLGQKVCNPNWIDVEYIHLVGKTILTDKGRPFDLILASRYSGQTRLYVELN